MDTERKKMQIVIKITEDLFTQIKDNVLFANSIPSDIRWDITDAIVNGTPLPKGHGRIGDLDVLREEVSSWGMNDYEPSDFIDAIDQADTIIGADKE